MKESWVNVHCIECGYDQSRRVSDLPGPDDDYECSCGRSAAMPEFLESERDLEVYDNLKA